MFWTWWAQPGITSSSEADIHHGPIIGGPRFFTPTRTVTLLLLVSFAMECAQYLKLYDATFDPWDLLAYVSILIPLFVLDLGLSQQRK